jgi:outer membrane protein assembly factor BamB
MSIRRAICRLGAFAGCFLFCGLSLAAPSITLSPPQGPPTTKIDVSGTGYGANAAVDIYFDTIDVCLVIATGAGDISCGIKVPREAQPHAHWISAVERGTNTGAQKPFTVRTNWAQFHGRDARHTGFNPFENTITTANVSQLDIRWRVPIGTSGTATTPAVWGGNVYIGGLDVNLYAFRAATGTPVPGSPMMLGGPVAISSPALGRGNVYIATDAPDRKLYAFKAATGATVPGFPVPLAGNCRSPAFYNGNVYVTALGTDKIYAFDAATGATVANFPVTTPAGVTTDVSAANGRIYAGSSTSLFAFDAVTGAVVPGYPKTTGNLIFSTPALNSGQVFFGHDSARLYGLRASDGTDLSGFPVTVSSDVRSSPAVGAGRVVFGSSDAKVHSVAVGDGSLLWSKTLDASVRSAPVIANGVVYVSSVSSLYALDFASGAILWRAGVSASELASPAVSDGIVFIGSTDGNLYAFSVNGRAPASRLPGGELGVRPALSSLKPDFSLKASK